VFILVVLLLLTCFIVSVFLAAWTGWFQAYIYTEPVRNLEWRAPIAGVAITLFVVLWVVCDYRSPGDYREWQQASITEKLPDFPELKITKLDGKEQTFRLMGTEYRAGNDQLPTRVLRLVAKRGDERYEFKPNMKLEKRKGADGKEREVPVFEQDSTGSVHYYAENGWEMVEGHLGHLWVSKPGRLFGVVLLNSLFLVVWFLCFWLVLQFQWAHALGQAFVCWLLMTLLVMPGLLNRVEDLHKERYPPTSSAPARTE